MRQYWISLMLAMMIPSVVQTGLGQELSTDALMKEARHQEQVLGDLDQAVRHYQAVLKRSDLSPAQEAEANLRLGLCLDILGQTEEARTHLDKVSALSPGSEVASQAESRLAMMQAADPAVAMPSNTFFYAEVTRPGEQVAQIVRLLEEGGIPNLLQTLISHANASTHPTGERTVLTPMGMTMLMNPSLIDELKKIEGLAVGLSWGEGQPKVPDFLAILYPGQSDAVRGLVQLLITTQAGSVEPYGDASIYSLTRVKPRAGQMLYAATTDKAVILGSPKSMVVDAIDRLKGTQNGEHGAGTGSLANQEAFQRQAAARRRDSAVLAYFDLNRFIDAVEELWSTHDKEGYLLASEILRIKDIEQISARCQFTEDGIAVEFGGYLKPGHNGGLYDILRTPPIDRKLLTFVPAEAPAFFTFSLDEGARRYDEWLTLAQRVFTLQHPKPDASPDEVNEQIRKLENIIGISLKNDLADNIEGILIGSLSPDLNQTNRPSSETDRAPGHDARNTSRPSGSVPILTGLIRDNAFVVLKVTRPEAFDITLNRLATSATRSTARQQDAEPVIQTLKLTYQGKALSANDVRRYVVPGIPFGLTVARVKQTYLITLSEQVMVTLLAAHHENIDNVLTAETTSKIINSIPIKASKVLFGRLDHALNLMHWGSISHPVGHTDPETSTRRQMASSRLTGLKPVVAYSIEEPNEIIARYELHGLPKLIQTFIGMKTSASRTQASAHNRMMQMHKIGQALMMYTVDHKGQLPASLSGPQFKKYLTNLGTEEAGQPLDEYILVLPNVDTRKIKDLPRTVLLYYRPGNIHPARVQILFADGHVEGNHTPEHLDELLRETRSQLGQSVQPKGNQ